MTAGCDVHVVVPGGIDDPARPSGGNVYDRRICAGLAGIGWSVHEHVADGPWPWPGEAAFAALAAVIAAIPSNAIVLLDGLIASTAPQVLVPQAHRLRLVILVHLPLGAGQPGDGPRDDHLTDFGTREGAVLSAAAAVVTTSRWTRNLLLELYRLQPNRVHVVQPGVDPADPVTGTAAGGELLCVAAVTPHKGQDVLLAALGTMVDLPWRCVCVGSLIRDPPFAARLDRQTRQSGIGDRFLLTGPRTGAELDAAYAAADVLVLASRAETYGMVVTEALARGLPVIASDVGGLREALGLGEDGLPPGVLVPPGDVVELAAALRRWLAEPVLRQLLRRAAQERRGMLSDWAATSVQLSCVLSEVGR